MDKPLIEELIDNFKIYENNVNYGGVYLICYHVEKRCTSPFIQFMLEKSKGSSELNFPLIHFIYSDDDVEKENIKREALKYTKLSLSKFMTDSFVISENMYKGTIIGPDNSTVYAIIDITGIDICGQLIFESSPIWFLLTTEIMNAQELFSMCVSDEVVNLFVEWPEIGKIKKSNSDTYNLPISVYTGGKMRDVKFSSVFGNISQQLSKNCGKYYFFNLNYTSIILKHKNEYENNECENNECDTIEGINRYALDCDGELYFEKNNELSLTDDDINNKYRQNCIIIHFNHNDCLNKPDVLVKQRNSFICLSYHRTGNGVLIS